MAALLVILASPAPRAFADCSTSQHDQTANSTNETLEILTKHGVDPAKISFQFSMDRQAAGSDRVGIQGHCTLLRDGIARNTIYFNKNAFGELKITLSSLQNEDPAVPFIGTGLGRLHYLITAKYLFDQTHLALLSDLRDDMSDQAKRHWMRLVQGGFANFVGLPSGTYQFDPGMLNSNPEIQALRDLYPPGK